MKFLPTLRPFVLVATALALNACETAANRRELYNSTEAKGSWHDYQRRRDAELQVGLPPGSTITTSATTTTTAPIPGPHSNRPTPQPRSAPPLSSDVTAPPSVVAPSSGPSAAPAPAPAPDAAAASGGASPVGTDIPPAPPAPPQ